MSASGFDVVVAGAGPAGCLAARLLADAGVRVLVVERSAVPRWKVCGACLGPGGLAVLGEAGLGGLPARGGAVSLQDLVLRSAASVARVPLAGSVAWSRTAMDAALLAAAVDAGATCWTEARARLGPLEGGRRRVRVTRAGVDTLVDAPLVLDATGLGGIPADPAAAPDGTGTRRVRPAPRERLGLRPPVAPRERVAPGTRVGLGAVFGAATPVSGVTADLPPGELHMVVGSEGYVGLVRLEDGTLDVAAAVDPEPLRRADPAAVVDRILEESGVVVHGDPELGWRGTLPLTREAGRVAEPGLFRIGDAMGYVEPFTGEGMGWALASARAVAPLAIRALRGWDRSLGAAWTAYHRRQAEHARRLCRVLSWALRRPALVRASTLVLARAPGLAAPMVRRAARVPAPPAGFPWRGAAANGGARPRKRSGREMPGGRTAP